MSKIKRISAIELLDSRGFPTIEASVVLETGEVGSALVPSGASTGKREAIELRDGDLKRFCGKGVQTAINHIHNTIAPSLVGMAIEDLALLDARMIAVDGTENKNHLGANAILAVSLALAKAFAKTCKLQLYQALNTKKNTPFVLPVPQINIINGGAHANNNLDIQEFMIIPAGFSSFKEALRASAEIFQTLKRTLNKKRLSTAVGDEGGFAPNLKDDAEALKLLSQAIEDTGYTLGKEVFLGLDVAASELWNGSGYTLTKTNKTYSSSDFASYLEVLCKEAPIISIEDGMGEEDIEGWKILSERFNKQLQLVGDDLFVTNAKILNQGVEREIANSILIKPNQIGTLTETFETIKIAQSVDYRTIMSHRSGETEDNIIADLCVAQGCQQIKAGSLCRSERLAKYNQLLRIEAEL